MSEKLKALQAQMEADQKQLEMELANGGGNAASDGGNAGGDGKPINPVESTMPQSSKLAVDEDDTDIERRALLRKRRVEKKDDASALSLGKIAAIVGVGVVVALLLLLLLFSGDSGGKTDTADPLTRSQLQRERPYDPCPDPWWIPEECTGSERVSKRDVWDSCEAFFKKYGYDVKYLKKCGIDMREGKQPKELKAKKDSGRRLLTEAQKRR